MIEFIARHADDVSFWLMSAIAIVSNILLHYERKAHRRAVETHHGLRRDLLHTKMELNSVVNTVKDFIDEHNYWHDRKIRFYYDQDGWHCCYDDEMPQGDTFIDQEEITQQNENNGQLPTSKGMSL